VVVTTKKRNNNSTHISKLVKSVLGQIRQSNSITHEQMQSAWKAVVGVQGAKHARPTTLRKGILRVAVENPGWIQELTMRKRRILRKLQSEFGKQKIADIRFKTGEVEN
jgi:predicted nucleic acid-binding Zn ribbon protein